LLNCYLYLIAEPTSKLRRPEKLLYLNWLNQDFGQSNLVTTDGQELSILATGRRNLLEGPDFKDAVLLLGKEIHKGDIEIHWKSSDWYSHGHEQDPLYDKVVLHVVAQHDIKSPIRTRSGRILPTFILKQLTELTLPEPPCHQWQGLANSQLYQVLQNFSLQRGQRKAQNWQNAILNYGSQQAFYLGWLDVLGYSQNRAAMYKLGQLLPLEKLYHILDEEDEEPIPLLEALLFGTAGFFDYKIPPGFKEDTLYFKKSMSEWHRLQLKYNLRTGLDLPWHFAGIRPVNYPHRRLAAFAQSFAKIYPHLPDQLIFNKLKLAGDFATFNDWLADLLQQPEGLWKNHPLLGNQRGKVLIGTQRLNDFQTNLVIPFCRAIAMLERDDLLLKKTAQFAEQVPAGELPNAVRRLWQLLGPNESCPRYNWIIQGALEYWQCYCELHLCNLCQLEPYAVK